MQTAEQTSQENQQMLALEFDCSQETRHAAGRVFSSSSFHIALLIAAYTCAPLPAGEPAQIKIIDESNGWPVPLVQLTTTHNVHFVSDNAGMIAIDSLELMNTTTWFTVEGHGYSVPKDGFGFAGVRLTPQPGKRITIEVQRQLPAKRLGRLTGAGLFSDSQKLGLSTGWQEQGLMGCDSVQHALYRDKLFWVWGDTTLASYPLGLFHASAATTSHKPLKEFVPPLRLRFDYFRDDKGKVREAARMPGTGPTWIGGLIALPSATGERLVATYVKVTPPLEVYEIGLCVWNDESSGFTKLGSLWDKSSDLPPPITPHGHPTLWKDHLGDEWVLFGDPFPTLRCRATFEAWRDRDQWESIEPQKSLQSRDGEKITPHRGSVAWNAYRKKWITIFCELNGSNSRLGEIWYAEADSPFGEWGPAVKVVTHTNYSFYNPTIHPEFVDADSPMVLFEATYTATFSKAKRPTPRYDYNQILYRLDLDELFAESP